ncbi:MAG: hypothetical protein WD844_05645 [Thermoleophilaceae bacterium]
MTRLLASLAALGTLLPAFLPAAADASRGQRTMFEDTGQLLESGPEIRAHTLDELKALGVNIVKVRVQWHELAPEPGAESKPAFDAADPSAYPQAPFAKYDDLVLQASQRGFRIFLMFSPPAPEWATARGERSGHIGVRRPDPEEFAAFVRAIGIRYGGAFGGLPKVSMWSIWNEPNHPQFIQPLSERLGGRLTPSAPHQYRRLYVAARQALGETGHDRDTILFGEILPIGSRRLGALRNIRPIQWLREFFCVDSRYRPLRGRAARVRGCSRFPRIRTSGFAYHAYSRPTGPRTRVANPDDATIGQIVRVERALDRIARTRRVRRKLPIYNTEFGIQTNPPDCVGFGAPLEDQASHINEAEYISWTRPRVRSYSNYLLIDDRIHLDRPPGSNARYGGFQSGLRFGENALLCESPTLRFGFAEEKPGYAAFRTPLWVRQLGPRQVEVFGRARPRGRGEQVIEILRSRRVVRTITARGYFRVRLRTNPRGTWQLRWTDGAQTYRSRTARAVPDGSRSTGAARR